jgi:hypothetical protein
LIEYEKHEDINGSSNNIYEEQEFKDLDAFDKKFGRAAS